MDSSFAAPNGISPSASHMSAAPIPTAPSPQHRIHVGSPAIRPEIGPAQGQPLFPYNYHQNGVVPTTAPSSSAAQSPNGAPNPVPAGSGATNNHFPFTTQTIEPPAKRVRLDGSVVSSTPQTHRPTWDSQQAYMECLHRQVFPYLDREVAKLDPNRVNTANLGMKVW